MCRELFASVGQRATPRARQVLLRRRVACCRNKPTPAPEHVVDTESVARVVDEGAQGELVRLPGKKKKKRSRTAKRLRVIMAGELGMSRFFLPACAQQTNSSAVCSGGAKLPARPYLANPVEDEIRHHEHEVAELVACAEGETGGERRTEGTQILEVRYRKVFGRTNDVLFVWAADGVKQAKGEIDPYHPPVFEHNYWRRTPSRLGKRAHSRFARW